jgi:hypothetical protein
MMQRMHIQESEQELETRNLKYLVVCQREHPCYSQAETYPTLGMRKRWCQQGKEWYQKELLKGGTFPENGREGSETVDGARLRPSEPGQEPLGLDPTKSLVGKRLGLKMP